MNELDRIKNYLSSGGLFNPELTEHEKVRELIVDCRDKISSLEKELSEAREVIGFYGDCKNWVDYSKNGAYLFFKPELPDDFYCEHRKADPIGGKRARQFLEKYQGDER